VIEVDFSVVGCRHNVACTCCSSHCVVLLSVWDVVIK
jgi:hypothetical protein